MYVLKKGKNYMSDPAGFPSRVGLTTDKSKAYVIESIKEAEWIAYMSDMEVGLCEKEKTKESSPRKEI